MKKIYPIFLFCIIQTIGFNQTNYVLPNSNASNNAVPDNNYGKAEINDLKQAIDTCMVLKVSNNKVENAGVWDIMPTTNFPNPADFIATTWTWGGDYSCVRSLLNFDLAPIPSAAIITDARLYFYWHNSNSNTGHSTLSGSNASWLRRITSPWNVNTVTWNNQPSTTTINQVYLPASSNDTMNYPNIDVTALIADIKNFGYGMMLMLDTEQYYRSLLFAACGTSDPTKTPWLKICYQLNSSISDYDLNQNEKASLYPDPANNILNIDYNFNINSKIVIEFYAIDGALKDRINRGFETKGQHNLSYVLNPEIFKAGIYFVKIISEKSVLTTRFIKIKS